MSGGLPSTIGAMMPTSNLGVIVLEQWSLLALEVDPSSMVGKVLTHQISVVKC